MEETPQKGEYVVIFSATGEFSKKSPHYGLVGIAIDDVIIDIDNKVVSTPAYMLGPGVADVKKGIFKLVDRVIQMTH